MKILEVRRDDKVAVRQFLELPLGLYKGDDNWIRPLDKDIEGVFDPAKNKFWRHGRAIRWILLDDNGKCIGRVAAFINDRTSNTEDQPTGGMGFFECINDQAAADMLFQACKDWLENQGMEAMDGPINFGDRNAWWGLLVEGFLPPTYQMNYNPPHYLELFENFGFKLYFKQIVLYRNIQEPVQQRFVEKYEQMMQEPGYSFRHIDKKQLPKFADDFLHIYNNAWGGHENFKKMRKEQSLKLMKSLKPILAEELAWFGYYKDEPIAFFIMIPDMNQIFKDFNGKLGLVQKLKTWYRLKFHKINQCFGIVFGVVPAHQGKGVDAGLIYSAGTVIHPQGHWRDMEMIWIGDFNPKMLNVAYGIGGKDHKLYITMRYLFDRDKPFERLPIMEK